MYIKYLILITYCCIISQQIFAINIVLKKLSNNSNIFNFKNNNTSYNNISFETKNSDNKFNNKTEKNSLKKILQYNSKIIKELHNHFAIKKPSVTNIGTILTRIKQLTEKKKHFEHDVNFSVKIFK